MALETYDQLKTAVADWLARDDLTSRIPEFITLTEARLNRELRCTQMETRSYTTVDMDSDEPEFLTLPGDFQTMRRVRLSGVTGKPSLRFVSQQQANDLRYRDSNVSGQPLFYTISGDEMELIPTPDSAYEIEMVYRANLTTLSDTDTTNWLLLTSPDAYLYGALLEAAMFAGGDARTPVWTDMFVAAVNSLNKLAKQQSFSTGGGIMIEGPTP